MSAPSRPVHTSSVFRNGFATAALALGIVGLGLVLTALTGPAAMVAGLLAVVSGALGMERAYRHGAGDAVMAAVGALAGLLAILLTLVAYLG